MFIDTVQIHVKAGDGGNGCVSFRREKYVARGGPDGGDGGNGGSILFRVEEETNTLLAFRYRRKFIAENGGDGAGAKFHGKNGADVVIPVPRGTLIRDAQSGRILHDMSDDGDFLLCRGGRGGWGNKHFATPTRQIPRFAKAGLAGEERDVLLELKMIADVGLVGLPSAGKSSLLAAVSAARPKIAEYHFTTLEPNLGVVSLGEGQGFVMADIPGLIDGAAEGAGLGHDFLRHIERCRLIVQVVDVSSSEGRAPLDDFLTISSELEKFSRTLAEKPRIVAANKADLLPDGTDAEPIRALEAEAAARGYPLVFLSAATGENTKALLTELQHALAALPPVLTYEAEPEPITEAEDADVSSVRIRRDDDGAFVCEGKWVDALVRQVNFDERESLMFFERVLQKSGLIDRLREAGCGEGNTVRMNGIEFDFVD